MKIAYAKLGRSWQLDPHKASTVGGDIDVVRLLRFLANEHPQHEFILVGRNTGQVPQEVGYPANVTNPWTEWRETWRMPDDPARADEVIEQFREMSGDLYREVDHVVIWAGQHGSANSRIPMIGTGWTRTPETGKITGGEGENLATPQFAFMNYCSWLLDFISRWREVDILNLNREEIWLVPDPRNYLKCRELRWPLRHPVLAQYKMVRPHKCERYGNFEGLQHFPGRREKSVYVHKPRYAYAGIELTALPHPNQIPAPTVPGSVPFGMVVNENRKGVKNQRLDVLQRWVNKQFPDAPIYGKWTDESQEALGRKISPVAHSELYTTLASFRTTFTTPASGSGWATSKPWECFATGAICFFHPDYDDQGHILPKRCPPGTPELVTALAKFLRVDNPAQLVERVQAVCNDDQLWRHYADLQRMYFEQSWHLWRGGAVEVERRLGLR